MMTWRRATRAIKRRAERAAERSALLPAWLLDEVYGSKLALHFYSPEELSVFRQAWLRYGAD